MLIYSLLCHCRATLCLCRAVPCFALAIITWRSTQCLCSASPSIRYHAVAARGFSQLGFAVASQCNALRALPLHNCALPLPNFAERDKSVPSRFISKLSRSFAILNQSTLSLCRSSPVASSLFLCWSPLSFSVLCHAAADHNVSSLLLCFSEPCHSPPLLCFSLLNPAALCPCSAIVVGRCYTFAT